MTWVARRHDLSETLVGVEPVATVTPAGEAGCTKYGVTARFDLYQAAGPSSVPRLTALWVSTIARDRHTEQVLASVSGLADALDDIGAEPLEVVFEPDDIVPGAETRLEEIALEAVLAELQRVFPTGAEEEFSAWRAGPGPIDDQESVHPIAFDTGDEIHFPLWWGGVPDDLVRTNPRILVPHATPGVVRVVDLPDLRGRDILVRVLDDLSPGPPRTVAVAMVDGDGRADISHADLPGEYRVELVDSTLRPEMTRAMYLRSIARQHAFVAVAAHRLGHLELGNDSWEWARDAYGRVTMQAGVVEDDRRSAAACNDAVRERL